MILAEVPSGDGSNVSLHLEAGNDCLWVNAYRGTMWLNAASSYLRWKDGVWFHGSKEWEDGVRFHGSNVAREREVTHLEAAALALDMLASSRDLFDGQHIESLLSADSMARVSVAVEVMEL